MVSLRMETLGRGRVKKDCTMADGSSLIDARKQGAAQAWYGAD